MKIDKVKISYKKCSHVEDSFIHQAFQDGFSDYIIKMGISEPDFIQRFFGPEGNGRDTSFIAFYEEQPIGVILGGIKNYEAIKTMRCGTLAIHPNFRGTGISHKLFEFHKEEAVKQGCKQLFLEVIVGNDRAINFYKKLGYEKVYDIVYYTTSDLSQLSHEGRKSEAEIRNIEFNDFQKRIQKWTYHINWQNDIDFLEKLTNNHYFGAYRNDNLVGCLSINSNGGISFLMVDKNARNQGIATQLLHAASKNLNLTKMAAGFPNNSLLEGFFKKHGFQKGTLAQYEMYLTL
ncbi:GNAT family N-acetyltransferase [Bacillus sp. MUM 116]|uniref:GNAT family N-acetyltransferase n=1 Tax=Bacillus sp. MUM 116 TaxID=1678002 RepID=UPI0008F5F75D|nr:GNAT family N-acetyltransferase [Bacillus sp. MUM 116]OIK06632.1 GNAT family N-acetyltransferase [Bacillus sp. MUM 116]